MQQFVVPQFIDIESKILGPITTRQFLWVMGAGLIFFVALRTLNTGFFVLVTILDVLIFGSFAFLKVNGQLFHNFLLNLIQFWRRPRLYIWSLNKEDVAPKKVEVPVITTLPSRPMLTSSRLKTLAFMVDTGGIYQPVESLKDKNLTTTAHE